MLSVQFDVVQQVKNPPAVQETPIICQALDYSSEQNWKTAFLEPTF